MKKVILFVTIYFFFFFALNGQNITWSDDIACIVYNKCVQCHHPGGVGPFSLMTYDDVFSRRAYIQNSVTEGSMPPWNANSEWAEYRNDFSLSSDEFNLLVDWLEANAPPGDLSQAPEAPIIETTESITSPDIVIQYPDYVSEAVDDDDYRCFVQPWTATQTNWVVGTEVVPGNKSIVHHTLFSWDPTHVAENLDAADPGVGYYCFGSNGSPNSFLLGGWAPGAGATIYPDGFGYQLPPGGNIVMQTHFPEGSAGESDATKINFLFSDESNLRNINGGFVLNHNSTLTNGPLFIPANTVKTFYSQITVNNKLTLLSVDPHMHLIGVSIKAFAVTPTGDTLRIIDIPHWDFDWQYNYDFKRPIIIPAGSTIYGEAIYDNTSNNPLNPSDPPIDVSQGEATTDEMFLIFATWVDYQPGDEHLYFEDDPPLVDCGTVGVFSPEIEQLVRIFPNPATDQIRISYDGKFSGALHIYDNNGRSIRRVESITLPKMVSLKGLNDGVYFLNFKNEAISFMKRVVISR